MTFLYVIIFTIFPETKQEILPTSLLQKSLKQGEKGEQWFPYQFHISRVLTNDTEKIYSGNAKQN